LRTPIGDPGCLAVYGKAGTTHRMLAEHLTAEYGITTEGRGRTVEEWTLRPNRDNEHFDNVVGCFAAASMMGVSLMGESGDRVTGSDRRRVDMKRWAERVRR